MMLTRTSRTARRCRGQSLVEYVLILAFASIALVGALGVYGGDLVGAFDDIVVQVNSL